MSMLELSSKTLKMWAVVLSALLTGMSATVAGGLMAAEGKQKFVTGGGKDSEFQLEVRQTALAEVLKLIATKTGVPVHYTVLPEGLITAKCAGSSLKKILECLINHKADIIVRYLRNGIKPASEAQIAEVWILGSKLEALPSNAASAMSTAQDSISVTQPANADKSSKQDQSNILLKIVALSKNPKDRAEAIGSLLSIGHENDPKIKAMLQKSVHDQNANVRAQAISTLTQREDYRDNAGPIIREALQDESVDVRLMAVDGISGEIDLLEQALNDSDETVRSFAAQKLAETLKNQKNQ